MSNQSPSANGQDQQGTDPSSRQRQPRSPDETGFGAGMDPAPDVPSDPDIEHTDDPSKD
jgi:hypothetical protein